MEMSPAAAVLEEWVHRFDLMRYDVQELLLRRQVFHRLQEIVASRSGCADTPVPTIPSGMLL